MKKKVLAITLAAVLALSLGLVFAAPVGADPGPITVWEIGVFDDAYNPTIDGTKPWPGGPVTETVDYEDESTLYAVLTATSTLTGTFNADLSAGAVLLVSWSPGGSYPSEWFSVTLDGITKSSRTVPGVPCTGSTVFPYPDGRCGWYWSTGDVPYYTEIFDFGPLGTGMSSHTLVISYSIGDGVGFDYLELTTPEPEEIDVSVDIKPSSCPNPLNVKSKGVIPVAILGTEDFDVTQIDPESIELAFFGPGSDPFNPPIPPDEKKTAFEDVATPYNGELVDCLSCWEQGPDGLLDLTLKFPRQAITSVLMELGLDEDEGCVYIGFRGNLKPEYGGTAITGGDMVRILNKGNNGNGPPPQDFSKGKGPKNK